METLKRVLTVMVVTLVLIIVVGGLYTFGMGNMNHGKSGQMNMPASQNQSQEQAKNNQTNTMDQKMASTEQSQPLTTKMESTSNKKDSPEQSQQLEGSKSTQVLPSVGIPVIIQPPVQPKTDPNLYVEQLKEKIKEINEANSQIASNSGGTMVMQQNGSSASQSNMNELHQGFYQLGQNVSSMEQAIDNLSKSVQNNNSGAPNYYGPPSIYAAPQPSQYPGQPQITYYPYGYPQNYYQYNPYLPNTNNQIPQPGQTPNQQNSMSPNMQSDPNMQANPNMQTDPNMQMSSNMQMNHSGFDISGLLSAKNIKLVFSLILLGSIVLGIVAVIGFIGSLFKPKNAAPEIAQP